MSLLTHLNTLLFAHRPIHTVYIYIQESPRNENTKLGIVGIEKVPIREKIMLSTINISFFESF